MGLSDVPGEILDNIIDHLEGDSTTLSRLSRSCRSLHRVIIPVLYSEVDLNCEKIDQSRQLQRFTKTILYNPHVSGCVKYLNLSGLEWTERTGAHHPDNYSRLSDKVSEPFTNEQSWEARITAYDRIDCSRLIDVVKTLPLVKEHMLLWVKALQEMPFNMDAIIGVLLASLPALGSLETSLSPKAVFVPYLLSQAAGRGHNVLDNLTHVKFDGEHYEGDSCIIGPMLSIPSLTHMFLHYWGPERRGDCTWIPSEQISPITHLEIRDAILDKEHLTGLLAPCSSLQTFILHRAWGSMWHHEGLLASSIAMALYPLRHTLKWVWLSYRPGYVYSDEEDEINPLDFSQFHSLTRLFAAARYIINDPEIHINDHCDPEAAVENASRPLEDRLPSSLEELRIMGPSKPELVPHIIKLLSHLVSSRARFPQLRMLCLEAPFSGRQHQFDTSVLRDQAALEGIKVQLFHNTFELRGERWTYRTEEYDWGFDGEFVWDTPIENDQLSEVSA